MPPIYLLRHGQTAWNAEGRYQGHLNSDLTPLGRYQAYCQGQILRTHGVDCPIWASPTGRARDTALIATAHLQRDLVLDPDLREITMGEFDGLTKAEIVAKRPEFNPYAKGWTAEAYGGESDADVYARARAVLDRVTEPTIIVTHGVYSRYFRGAYFGLSHDQAMVLPQDQGCVYVLDQGGAECWVD